MSVHTAYKRRGTETENLECLLKAMKIVYNIRLVCLNDEIHNLECDFKGSAAAQVDSKILHSQR